MAYTLSLPIVQPQPVIEDNIYDIVQSDISTPVALPMPPVLIQMAKAAMEQISSPISSRRLDLMYRLQEQGIEFVLNHPKPNSGSFLFCSGQENTHHSQ